MKPRIQIDSLLLLGVLIVTLLVFQYPSLYRTSPAVDNILDFLGLMFVLDGILLRMCGRGHKKARSRQSEGLVTTGIYSLTRNPMYLGSFLIGFGFSVSVWPWWFVLIFMIGFYLRFNIQMVNEEEFLRSHFGQSYEDYCRDVPRIVPRWNKMMEADWGSILSREEMFSTHEKRLLVILPVALVLFEFIQEKFVFSAAHLGPIIGIDAAAAVVYFAIFVWWMKTYGKNTK